MFKELEKKVRKPDLGSLSLYQRISRKLALPITFIIVKTGVTPNQITFFNILLSLCIGSLFLFPTFWNLIIGTVLIYLAMILDRVDGQVARYKSMESLRGKYLDGIFTYVLFFSIFFLLGTGFYLQTGDVIYLFMGAIIVLLNCFVSVNVLNRAVILGTSSLGTKKQSSFHSLLRAVAFFPFKFIKEILLLAILLNLPFLFFAFYTAYSAIFSFGYAYILSRF